MTGVGLHVILVAADILVGWLCFTSHWQRGHLETAPPFTVPCKEREARLLHRPHQELNPGSLRGSPLHNSCVMRLPAPLIFWPGSLPSAVFIEKLHICCLPQWLIYSISCVFYRIMYSHSWAWGLRGCVLSHHPVWWPQCLFPCSLASMHQSHSCRNLRVHRHAETISERLKKHTESVIKSIIH